MVERVASTYVISLTPFTAAGALDEDGLRGHFRRLAAAGIGVYVAGSGSGEAYTLNDHELLRVLQIAKEELHGKVPVRAMGRGPRTAGEMIKFCALVREVGLDAAQIYSLDIGHGNKPSDRELEAYLSEVLESVDGPCVISIHQSVGYLYPIDLLRRSIDRFDRVLGLNMSTGDIQYLGRLIDAVDGRVEVHCGGPAFALSTLALGGNGYLSSEANLAPKLCVSLIDHYNAGRLVEAERAYRNIMHLWPVTYRYGSIRGTKAALQLLGLPGGYPRMPRMPVPDDALAEIRAQLDQLGLAEIEGFEAAVGS
jgi:4-hydroxy-tetrahydrodipicolinate synthase